TDSHIVGAFDSQRECTIARGLLEREIRRRLRSGELHFERRRQPESLRTRVLSITILLAIAASFAVALPFMLAEYLEEIDTFEPAAARLAMVFLSIASLVTMPLMFFLTFFFAWREDRRRPLDLFIRADGMTAL